MSNYSVRLRTFRGFFWLKQSGELGDMLFEKDYEASIFSSYSSAQRACIRVSRKNFSSRGIESIIEAQVICQPGPGQKIIFTRKPPVSKLKVLLSLENTDLLTRLSQFAGMNKSSFVDWLLLQEHDEMTEGEVEGY